MSAQPEVWRVSTPEGVFETDLETLKQWILEGCVLPTDKVRKGNLSWIDAGRVPKLKGAFKPVSQVSTEPSAVAPGQSPFLSIIRGHRHRFDCTKRKKHLRSGRARSLRQANVIVRDLHYAA